MPRPVAPVRPRYRFRLDHDFLAPFHGKQPAFGPLGLVTFKRTYAKTIEAENRSEEFWECCQRVTEATFSYLWQQIRATGQRWDQRIAQRKAQEFFTRMWQLKWLPPGRGLQFMDCDGALQAKGSAILQNCGFYSTKDIDDDFARPFCRVFDLLMLGVGMGFDVRGRGKVTIQTPKLGIHTFVVEDSREGWVDALRAVMEPFIGKGALPARFDYSQIRPAGAPLKTLGGTSSGSAPLEELLSGIMSTLVQNVGRPITSTTLVHCFTKIGRAVVSGNLRRSAEIALGNADDAEFLSIKDPSRLNEICAEMEGLDADDPRSGELVMEAARHPLRTHLWAANNTVFCEPGQHYAALAKQTATNGEPGYLWLANIRTRGRMADAPNYEDVAALGCNPCSEQPLHQAELCCLVETFPTLSSDIEDYKRTLKMAFLYAKVVTTIPTHLSDVNAQITKNRRIGLSMAGVFEMVETIGLPAASAWWNECYQHLRELDAEYSGWMGIPRSIRVSSIKPGGSVPLIPGVEGGMKIPTARYYHRTMRVASGSPIVAACHKAGYRVEDDLYSPNTAVIYFPVQDPSAARVEGTGRRYRSGKDVSMWEQAAILAELQAQWADNMCSVTLVFQPHEAGDIERLLEAYERKLKSVSFLPFIDHGYQQAPYAEISKEQYEAEVAALSPIDLSGVTQEVKEAYCDGGVCEIQKAS